MENFSLTELNYEFDSIIIDPPLEEYQRRCPGLMFNWRPWHWDEIIRLEIGQIAAQRSFCFLWCGSAEGLDEGRKCLKAWGMYQTRNHSNPRILNKSCSKLTIKKWNDLPLVSLLSTLNTWFSSV